MEPIFMRTRMAQIRKHLGPVLNEMGLEAVCFDEGWRYVVDFEKGRSFSPVSLQFPHKCQTDATRPPWNESKILHGNYSKKRLGRTGWVHMRNWGNTHLAFDGVSVDKVDLPTLFASLAARIRGSKLATYEREPKKMSSHVLADVFWQIDGRIADIAVTRVEDDQLPGREDWEWDALTFIDHEGRRIHICLRQGDGRGPIYADGEQIAWLRTSEFEKVAEYAVALSSGINIEKATLRP